MGTGTRPDVIVVGGGSAGCVVAAELARRGDRRVLLLEAGPDRRDRTAPDWLDGWRLPAADSLPDWGYRADGSGQTLRRGRLLGGTSWLTRFAVRGAPADFDAWAVSAGDPRWRWDAVLPVFRRIEADREFGAEPWHGSTGPFPITRRPDLEPAPVHRAALDALEAAGLPAVADHNRPGALGVGRLPMSTADGRRVTTLDAWLGGGVPERLTIRGDAPVARVLFDGTRARGVALVDGSEVHAGEVVLCAGTYGSPTILLRSGIGPAADLGPLGIEVLVDLPGVGTNLADHPAVELDSGLRGSGVASGPILHSIATWRSSGAASDGPPDLMTWITDPIAADPSIWLDAILLKPTSRGSVRLQSADPADPPRIRLPGLRTAEDVARIQEGLAFLVDVAERPEIRRVATGPRPATPASVADEAYSLPHVVGTCAMGADARAGAVVDADARVHGASGLAVVDASIVPEPPSGFPQLITVMAAVHLVDRWTGRD